MAQRLQQTSSAQRGRSPQRQPQRGRSPQRQPRSQSKNQQPSRSQSPSRGRRNNQSPNRSRQRFRSGSRGRRRSFSPKRGRKQGKNDKHKQAAKKSDSSVGSTLSTADQFDIIVPYETSVRIRSKRPIGNTANDDISSITSNEHRKYGSFPWQIECGSCDDCLFRDHSRRDSCDETSYTEVNGVLQKRQPQQANSKVVNFKGKSPARGRSTSPVRGVTKNNGLKSIFCGLHADDVYDDRTSRMTRSTRGSSRSRSPSRRRRGSSGQRNRSPNRKSSLFDDALLEDDDHGRRGLGWFTRNRNHASSNTNNKQSPTRNGQAATHRYSDRHKSTTAFSNYHSNTKMTTNRGASPTRRQTSSPVTTTRRPTQSRQSPVSHNRSYSPRRA